MNTNACVLLAEEHITTQCGNPEEVPTELADYEGKATYNEAVESARAGWHQSIIERFRAAKPATTTAGGAVTWLGTLLTWHQRITNLVTWGGQQSLASIINDRVAALADLDEDQSNIFSLRAPLSGSSGLDFRSCSTAINIGYSTNEHAKKLLAYPAVELLAIIAAETAPLISFGRRDCGVMIQGRAYRFSVIPRTATNRYYYYWGPASPQA